MPSRHAPTPSQTVGPFFAFALPFPGDSQAADPADPNTIRVEGQLLDGDGRPVPDGLLELWDENQLARCGTDAEGSFHFLASRPTRHQGPDGRLQAAHLTLGVFARGLLRQLVTRIYLPDDAATSTDPVLELVEPDRRRTLLAAQEGDVLRFDVHLQGEQETVFFAI